MDDIFPWGETDPLMDELKAAAFEYLLLNPGSDFGDWQKGLIEDYPAEVVDALGNNPAEVYSDLADLWESDYLDHNTGIEQKFSDWAESFANDRSVELYDMLVDAKRQISRLETSKRPK